MWRSFCELYLPQKQQCWQQAPTVFPGHVVLVPMWSEHVEHQLPQCVTQMCGTTSCLLSQGQCHGSCSKAVDSHLKASVGHHMLTARVLQSYAKHETWYHDDQLYSSYQASERALCSYAPVNLTGEAGSLGRDSSIWYRPGCASVIALSSVLL